MTIFVKTEINLSRVLREDVESPDDLARLALEALDQCAHKFHKQRKAKEADIVGKARTELTGALRDAFPA